MMVWYLWGMHRIFLCMIVGTVNGRGIPRLYFDGAFP